PGALALDFDEERERVLFIGRRGLISTWRIDGTDAENLPGPLVDAGSLHGVIGVAGGFVLLGKANGQPVLAHYDFTSRNCAIHTLDVCPAPTSWFYYRDLHTLAGRGSKATHRTLAVDLAETGDAAARTPRATRAAMRADAGMPPSPLASSQLWR